jgi:hypothetical protein
MKQLTPCPRCGDGMIHVTAIPHQRNPMMLRHTFICRTCNQTRSYMLPAEIAYAAAGAELVSPFLRKQRSAKPRTPERETSRLDTT